MESKKLVDTQLDNVGNIMKYENVFAKADHVESQEELLNFLCFQTILIL